MIKGPNKNDVKKLLDAENQKLQLVIFTLLRRIGYEAVNIMRQTKGNDYMDQTGNLRSSTGFIVAFNGTVKSKSNFSVVKDGTEGAGTGKALATKIAVDQSNGNRWCLVLVAGMKYASYVQNYHGRDVIESASVYAENEARKLIGRLSNGN